MQISTKTASGTPKSGVCVLYWAAALALIAPAGCASPGPPLPPTLNLPEIPAANSLSAERLGPAVTVRWMTPERTTDRLLIRGAVEAEICREVVSGNSVQRDGTGRTAAAAAVKAHPCSPVVARASAQPGAAGDAVDVLPGELASGPARLLAYRVQLKNAAGRTAGASSEVFAAAGDAPAPVAGLRAHAAKAGVVLEWTAERGSNGARVELERTLVGPRASGQKERQGPVAALGAPEEPTAVRLRAGENITADPGGTVDRSAEIGHTYSYTAWRVRTVQAGGRQVEVRSALSPAVTVIVQDVFPPDTPAGLVAVPGFVGEGDAARPAIDLSWEPNDEPRIAGYRVYRRDAGGWRQISGAQPLTNAAYRDTDISAGQRYAYRVTAVGLNGLESAPSAEAAETAAAP